MSHGFMHGMIWASILLSSIPVGIMLAGGIWLLRRFREERGSASER